MTNRVEIVATSRNLAGPGLDAATKQATGLGKSVGRVGEIAQGILAAQLFQQIGQSAHQFLGKARTASSDLGESVNAVEQVFGDQAAAALRWGRDNATAFGLSERAFNQAVTPMGAVLANTGMEMGAVTTNTLDLTQRAADMASVFNTDVTTALDAIGSGLRGETEPLRQYGVTLTAAAVEAQAMADTGKQSASALTEQEKAAARVAIILQQTEAVAGDFAATSDGLANSQRILAAEMETAQAITGNLMVPALEALNAILIPLVQVFNSAPAPLQVVIGTLVLLGTAAVAVTSRIAPMIIAMQASGISAGTLATKARAATLAVASLGLAIGAAGVGIIAWGTSARHTSENITGLTEDVERFIRTGRETASLRRHFGEGAEGVDEFADKLDVATAGFFNWSDSLNRSFDEISQAKSAFQDLDTAMAGMVDQGADSDEIMQRLIDTYDLSKGQVEQLRSVLPKYTEAAERATERTGDLAGAQEGAADAAAAAGGPLAAIASHFDLAGDSAEDAADKMIDAWSAASADFITVGGVYESALDRKNAAESRSGGSAVDMAEVHEDAAKRIEQAARAVERAKEDEAQTAEQVADRIEDAQEQVAKAEERLADAQTGARQAQVALTEARREAADQLAAFEGRIVDAELSEEAAILRLNRAIEAQNKLRGDRKASGLDIQEADLAYRQAERNLQRVREELADLRSEEAQAQRRGVEGSDLVQGALQRQREAAELVIEAQQGIVDAQEAVNDAHVEGARAMRDAAERVADSQEAMAEAAEEAAESIADAAGGAGGAMRGLADDTKITAKEYIDELGRMVAEQEEWANNLIELSAKVPPAMLDELARLGPEGAAEVALLNSMSSSELDRVIGLFERKGRSSGRGFAANLADSAPQLAAIAARLGEDTAVDIARAMARNGTTVQAEARRIGIRIRRGVGSQYIVDIFPQINLAALNRAATQIHGLSARQVVASGGIIGGLASGGIAGAQAGGIHGARVLVGERRAEVVEIPRGSRVIPSVDQATDRNQLAAAGSGSAIVLRPDGRRVTALLVEIMREALRTDPAFRSDLRAAVR